MVKQSDSERRLALRAKRILSIQYRLSKAKAAKGANTQWQLSTTQDMSAIGLKFLSDIPFQVDQILELHVVMSGILDIFRGYAKVVRVEKKTTGAFYLIAVKFVKNPDISRKAKVYSKVTSNRLKKSARHK